MTSVKRTVTLMLSDVLIVTSEAFSSIRHPIILTGLLLCAYLGKSSPFTNGAGGRPFCCIVDQLSALILNQEDEACTRQSGEGEE